MAEYRLAPKAWDDMEAVWLFHWPNGTHGKPERYIDSLTDAFGVSGG